MRNKCIVWKCENKGVHRLPKDEELKNKWIVALKLNVHKKVGRKLTANSVVCSGHFKSTDFISRSTTCEGKSESRNFSWIHYTIPLLCRETVK